MNKSTIQTLIDKVIGKKGLIRVPSWWMRKVLMQMADWVQEGDDTNGKKIVKVKEEADGKISTLETNVSTLETNTNSKIDTLKAYINNKFNSLNTSLNSRFSATYNKISAQENDANNIFYELVETAKLPMSIKCFAVKTESKSGVVYVEGKEAQSIPANAKRVILFIDNFSFKGQLNSPNNISFIGFGSTDTSAVTSMGSMFGYCSSLTSLDLSSFNTSAVTDMQAMFIGCTSLTSLDLSSFDTSAVPDMSYMFANCKSLTSLNLSSFDTSAVKNMADMFDRCSKLTSLDLTGFDTSAVTNMADMFNGCTGLTSLNLSSFDTSAVTSMESIFCDCSSLTSLDLSSFDTSAVGKMNHMFWGCSSLTSLDLSSFDTSAVTSMLYMFRNCSSLTSLILGPNFFKTPNVTDVDFSYSTQWTNDTVVTSLVTNSYDRATVGLRTMTLKLSANTKAALTDEQKAAITAKGYTIA